MKNIDINTPIEEIQKLLESLGWISDEHIAKVTIPGEGNMNVVLRIKTDKRSFILKQSRPFVQKYPDLPAPLERIDVEYQFYKATEKVIADHSATIVNYAPDHHLMMIADLGDCEDMVSIYAEKSITEQEVINLVNIAERIHAQSPPNNYPQNLELRQLNHQHIFELPFIMDNGFHLDDIQSGLQELSLPYKRDDQLKSVVNELGEKYLAQGTELIHGDYYPGSWMRANDKIYIIDSEFSFIGFKEFDLGVMVGHLIMTSSNLEYLNLVTDSYISACDGKLVSQIAGVEIMRRLIGLAQLPLERTLNEKADLLSAARKMILI